MTTYSYTIIKESVQDNDLMNHLMAARRGELEAHRIESLLEEVQGARNMIGSDEDREDLENEVEALKDEVRDLEEAFGDEQERAAKLGGSVTHIEAVLLQAEHSIASGHDTAENAFAAAMQRIRDTEDGFDALPVREVAE